jgi:hypothetical protein
MEGIDELAGKSSYFLGGDSRKWQTDVRTYSKVRQKGVYPGIDLVWHGNQQQLEYDFVVAPGANPGMIDIGYRGAGLMKVYAGGDLVIAVGGTEIRQHKPIAYQEVNGIRKQLVSRICVERQAPDWSKDRVVRPSQAVDHRPGARLFNLFWQ